MVEPWCHMDCLTDVLTMCLGTFQLCCCPCRVRKLLDFIKNILMCVLKMNRTKWTAKWTLDLWWDHFYCGSPNCCVQNPVISKGIYKTINFVPVESISLWWFHSMSKDVTDSLHWPFVDWFKSDFCLSCATLLTTDSQLYLSFFFE